MKTPARAHQIASVLTIAGSDSSGGAGVQADLKTICAHGLYGQSAITALTAQNTLGVTGVMDVPANFVEAQLDAIFADIRPAAVKIGMLPTPEVARAVAGRLAAHGAQNVVVDPVMVATSGSSLATQASVEAMVEHVLPLARVVTPNGPEACALTGIDLEAPAQIEKSVTDQGFTVVECVTSEESIERALLHAKEAACAIARLAPGAAVLVKGGHGLGGPDHALDLLRLDSGRFIAIASPRINTQNTHGTGCTLSSAIACNLAAGASVEDACRAAKRYISAALAAGLNLGHGNGPLAIPPGTIRP